MVSDELSLDSVARWIWGLSKLIDAKRLFGLADVLLAICLLVLEICSGILQYRLLDLLARMYR